MRRLTIMIEKSTHEKNLDLLKKAFGLNEVRFQEVKGGFFSKTEFKYFIPEMKFLKQLDNYLVLKTAVKSGLVAKDRRRERFIIHSSILDVRGTDKRAGKKQFFNFNNNDRTTLYDALQTITKVDEFAEKMGLNPKNLKYTIRHEDGDPERVLNYITFDASVFGRTKEEIKRNIDRINKLVKFERRAVYG
jgi:hypothetical protein